jgi:hypothetical protein
MRRVKRVLLSDHGEAMLLGLFQHKLHRLDVRLQNTLTTTVMAHKELRAAFDGDLGRDGLGVLHRALRLTAEICPRLEVRDERTTRVKMGFLACLTCPSILSSNDIYAVALAVSQREMLVVNLECSFVHPCR